MSMLGTYYIADMGECNLFFSGHALQIHGPSTWAWTDMQRCHSPKTCLPVLGPVYAVLALQSAPCDDHVLGQVERSGKQSILCVGTFLMGAPRSCMVMNPAGLMRPRGKRQRSYLP